MLLKLKLLMVMVVLLMLLLLLLAVVEERRRSRCRCPVGWVSGFDVQLEGPGRRAYFAAQAARRFP